MTILGEATGIEVNDDVLAEIAEQNRIERNQARQASNEMNHTIQMEVWRSSGADPSSVPQMKDIVESPDLGCARDSDPNLDENAEAHNNVTTPQNIPSP